MWVFRHCLTLWVGRGKACCRYLPSVVGVAPFFTDNRALAIGICLCGSGVRKWVVFCNIFPGRHIWPRPHLQLHPTQVAWNWLTKIQTKCTFLSFASLLMTLSSSPSSSSSSISRWSWWWWLQARLAMGDAHFLRPLLALHLLWGSHGNRWVLIEMVYSWMFALLLGNHANRF